MARGGYRPGAGRKKAIQWRVPAHVGPNTSIDNFIVALPLSDERKEVYAALIDDDGGYEATFPRHKSMERVGDLLRMTPEEITRQAPQISPESSKWLQAHLNLIKERYANG